ncbi:hypothetical protein [Pseudomonas lundensis]|uniref:hypothetical protein n=1 Tax=Pseudomonas lundensis TaxID=86185 RepID=UPI00193C1629|nr:hypothetical protein [Pseudomonas lundensis]MBM1186783.1 hypothetical protein [Pseudomonas lundensis]
MSQKKEGLPLVAGIDVQAEKIVMELRHADQLDSFGRSLIGEADRIRRTARPFIHLELHSDGLISIQAWKEGRQDSSYPPRSLDSVLQEITLIVDELGEPTLHSSSDK